MGSVGAITGSFGIFAKLGILFFLFLYIIFSIMVIRQVNVMIETLRVGAETPIKAVAYAHVILSVLVFAVAVFVL